MEKTKAFEIAEAYQAGFDAALAEVPEAVKRIEEWKLQPENQLVMAVREYMAAIIKQGGK